MTSSPAVSALLKLLVLVALAPVISCTSQNKKPMDSVTIDSYRMDEQRLVSETVLDKDRQSQVFDLLSERDVLIDRQVVLLCGHAKSIRELNRSYSTTREQYVDVLAQFNAKRWAIQKEYVYVIGGMKEVTTTTEWRKLANFQQKYLHANNLTVKRVLEGDACS